ncbi:hypothetical protein HCH_03374 [Hahella chejuensis KCTC 2396]|uniref:Secreted protein n=1 Tax=Hahella chejuensis (strain KCTC 2396) TaxID=349521 RepID=Q2SGU9_HAHCH|nr:hypothetical protein [Hahella chejuensis]ABC30125.1 hypothetical protein HCH_03374 [Hahella chejuensis KCTC 2396]
MKTKLITLLAIGLCVSAVHCAAAVKVNESGAEDGEIGGIGGTGYRKFTLPEQTEQSPAEQARAKEAVLAPAASGNTESPEEITPSPEGDDVLDEQQRTEKALITTDY